MSALAYIPNKSFHLPSSSSMKPLFGGAQRMDGEMDIRSVGSIQPFTLFGDRRK